MLEQIARILSLSDTPRYNIKAVVQRSQVNISTLRAWEQRYGVPRPNRSEHGHRLYSERDLAIVRWLKQCTEDGLAISQAVAMLRDVNTLQKVSETHETAPRADLQPGANWPDLRRQLRESLGEINLRQAHLIVNTACAMFPLDTVILELFQPLLAEIGEQWAQGKLCVAEERIATNFVRQRLLALIQLHAPFAHGPRLVCACVPGEQHEIGLLMFALLMEQRGWEMIYLGQSVSLEGLPDFLSRMTPALLCVSVSLVEHVTGLMELGEMIATRKLGQLGLAYGGRIFSQFPELCQRLPGSYLGANLHDAVNRADDMGEEIDRERWLSAAAGTYRTNGIAHLAISAAG